MLLVTQGLRRIKTVAGDHNDWSESFNEISVWNIGTLFMQVDPFAVTCISESDSRKT